MLSSNQQTFLTRRQGCTAIDKLLLVDCMVTKYFIFAGIESDEISSVVSKVMKVMEEHDLTKEDRDSTQ